MKKKWKIQVTRKAVRTDRAPYKVSGYKVWVKGNLSGYFSVGNAKLKDIFVWNLPPGRPADGGTCPGSTDDCLRYCYAKKGYATSALPARQRNLEFSHQPYFRSSMIFAIRLVGASLVRIHEAGDFYSRQYLEDWIAVARCLSNVRFAAFTRSAELFDEDLQIPENMKIRFSMDAGTDEYPELDIPLALTVPWEDRANYGDTLICPADRYGKDRARCNLPCKYCWVTDNHVIFPIQQGSGQHEVKIPWGEKFRRLGDLSSLRN